jgi:hypothetical protein
MAIPMHPREPLTHKAEQAICAYAIARCRDLLLAHLLIKYTLEAERMPRQRLYDWLDKHGYKHNPRSGWHKEHKQ